MRIALYHDLPPGGGRRLLLELVRRTRQDHEYELFLVDSGDGQADMPERESVAAEVPLVHRVRAGSWLTRVLPPRLHRGPIRLLGLLGAERRIAAAVNAGGFDACVVFPSRFTHSPALIRWVRVATVFFAIEPRRRSFEEFVRRPWPPPTWRTVAVSTVVAQYDRVVRRLDRKALRAASEVIAISRYAADLIEGFYGRHALVCYPGVDGEVFSAVASPTRERRVLSVGTLDRTKGHDFVVRSLGTMPATGRPTLGIVYSRGVPGYEAHLNGLAAELGVRLEFHRDIADAELVALYRGSVATMCGAVGEPFGLTPIESIACGTPVVAVREAGFKESINDGVNGFLVERRPEAMGRALARVMAGDLEDDPLALNRTVLPRWSWAESARIFADILSRCPQPPR